MKSFENKVAAITGAGSGIGRALAFGLARQGCQLALSDVNAEGLAETAAQARKLGVQVSETLINVADREAAHAWADQVAAEFGRVNAIFNNAGVAQGGTVEGNDYADYEWIMNINFWGVVNGTKAFLPHLIASGDGHVINISSIFGLFAVPGQAAYNSAKFAVRGFTEALRMEMALAGHPVKVTTVHPGGIKTAIARNATGAEGIDTAGAAEWFDKMARTSPERAAQVILDGVAKNKAKVLVGADAKILDTFVRASGSGYQRALTALAGRFMPRMR